MRTITCERCGEEILLGSRDTQCGCGQWYNAFGQTLRDDWQNNPSNWSDMGDLEGSEFY